MGPQVLDAAWASRLKVARRDIGEGMTMAEVDQLCETIDLRALPAYWAAVGERTAAVVSALTPGALDSVINPKELEWAIVDERMLSGPLVPRPQELWAGMTRGFFLMYLPFIHNYEHIGQADLLRGCWGGPGPSSVVTGPLSVDRRLPVVKRLRLLARIPASSAESKPSSYRIRSTQKVSGCV